MALDHVHVSIPRSPFNKYKNTNDVDVLYGLPLSSTFHSGINGSHSLLLVGKWLIYKS